ncbi:MAG TPA: alpha-L-arabinofuranosidase C-terminal domain-containing protein [Terracidiphilus sp.]|nr:alpha-L-arabinofuranosidase C-terminal domain-containing protein [Terracidiphilus sp.]
MNTRRFAIVMACAAFLLAPIARAQSSDTAVLTIHADQASSKVSPTLYGLMTEEINHSYEGGLWGELIQNSTFRSDWSGVNDWILVEDGNSEAKLSLDKGTGPSEALPYSLRVEVSDASARGPAGVRNGGFWGIPLHPNTAYQGSFFAKEDSSDVGSVAVSLVANQSGKVLASTVVPGIATDWKQYKFTLKTGAIEPGMENHLVLTVAHPGSLWLQLVSLFPPTYHDRANGNRIDLMEKLAAMHPQFLRFPGGNYLEGDHLSEWYDWKKTIGPRVDRPGHPSPWRYWSTDGFGLLEFLEWCEDLHMHPVLAVYAGYSLMHEHINPGPDLEPYVQSALDEIEYVTGGPDTKWGARRAADGHPEPFHLTYVEVGNEDQFDTSGSYDGRYEQFYKAIKAKYPDLQLIATTPIKSMKPDVLDDHYYLRATDFFHDAKHYDKADREGPKIFVGEWATREGSPTPNMGAALGDAAWMTGMERNSDLIVMASYAPLLVNISPGAMQWSTDLIGYDAMRSYGSPSYYAQVMFGSYLGDTKPDSSVEGGGSRFFYSVTQSGERKKIYVKLVNASSDAQAVEIKLTGAKLAPEGRLISLSAHDPEATNTIDQPKSIAPVESALGGVADTFHHRVPPYTIEVLVLDTR